MSPDIITYTERQRNVLGSNISSPVIIEYIIHEVHTLIIDVY